MLISIADQSKELSDIERDWNSLLQPNKPASALSINKLEKKTNKIPFNYNSGTKLDSSTYDSEIVPIDSIKTDRDTPFSHMYNPIHTNDYKSDSEESISIEEDSEFIVEYGSNEGLNKINHNYNANFSSYNAQKAKNSPSILLSTNNSKIKLTPAQKLRLRLQKELESTISNEKIESDKKEIDHKDQDQGHIQGLDQSHIQGLDQGHIQGLDQDIKKVQDQNLGAENGLDQDNVQDLGPEKGLDQDHTQGLGPKKGQYQSQKMSMYTTINHVLKLVLIIHQSTKDVH
ncbi:hypothetical protein AYI69_g5482 [Smittium culicis]|uniref:Uncharacterized protein n=1 Tax=Smittium culicis TaxID=133412 RepID=A0A1R1Y5E3_9FUNG|nr:hypothetical protein AYI69_g5482 [Smittium culicis]